MAAVAVDPNNANVVYAGGEAGGVWKSTDGGSSWSRASTGLGSGETSVSSGALAVDGSNSLRLLYGVADDDLSPNKGGGGLYASVTGAWSWFHVDLPGCATPTIRGVVFGGGKRSPARGAGSRSARIRSSGRGASSTRTAARTSSRSTPWRPSGPRCSYAMASSACSDRETSTARGARTRRPRSPGPVTRSPRRRTARRSSSRCTSIRKGTGGSASATRPRARPPTSSASRRSSATSRPCRARRAAAPTCTRRAGRRRPRGLVPGKSYSVFAANGSFFYEYTFTPEPVHPIWRQLAAMHVDSHGMAIPSNYDPAAGRCRVYLANNDRRVRDRATGSSCTVASSRVVKAMHGLHGFGSFGLALIPRSTCSWASRPLVRPCISLRTTTGPRGRSPAGTVRAPGIP